MAPHDKLQLGSGLLPLVRGVAPPGRVVLPGGLLWLRIGRKQCQMGNEGGGRDGPPERGTTRPTDKYGSLPDSGGFELTF